MLKTITMVITKKISQTETVELRFLGAWRIRSRILQAIGLPIQQDIPQPPAAWLAPEAGGVPPTFLAPPGAESVPVTFLAPYSEPEPLHVGWPPWIVPLPLFIL